jgi:hypothetical protein
MNKKILGLIIAIAFIITVIVTVMTTRHITLSCDKECLEQLVFTDTNYQYHQGDIISTYNDLEIDDEEHTLWICIDSWSEGGSELTVLVKYESHEQYVELMKRLEMGL